MKRYAIFNKKELHIEEQHGVTRKIGMLTPSQFSSLLTEFAKEGYTTEGSDRGIFSSTKGYQEIKAFIQRNGLKKSRTPRIYRTTTTHIQPFIVSIMSISGSTESVKFIAKVAKWAKKLQGHYGLAGDPFYTSWGVQVRINSDLEINRKMAKLLIFLTKKDMRGLDTKKALEKAQKYFNENRFSSKQPSK